MKISAGRLIVKFLERGRSPVLLRPLRNSIFPITEAESVAQPRALLAQLKGH